ncbi:hypothetical protein [Sphingopyxis sp.]|uniref:hypothetical protein n=1 Tax=Sphingopyxis sp. TaxID=1908224 RepID=UPI001DDE46C4|nr:hypothetical protein [Sphingopyxis sp.]MBW8295693.1 hypothetical protein [Sphingopyxis sp.]
MPAPVPEPKAPAKLGRADLVGLAAQAADAFASGESLPENISDAAGQRFELLLPFGCTGPSDAESNLPARWSFDEEDGVLRISFKPEVWGGADWGLGDQAAIDAAEGFWIARPWSSSDRCPPRSDQGAVRGADPVTLPGQSLAIAQIFRDDADRDGWRSGRAFDVVKRVDAEAFDGSQGFRLRVTGRLENIAGGAPIRCVQPGGSEQRPRCLIGARIDTVRIEDPASDDTLATWSITRQP